MKWVTIVGMVGLGLGAFALTGCDHIEEPWTDYAAEYKVEKFTTDSPDAELRHRLQYTQTDR